MLRIIQGGFKVFDAIQYGICSYSLYFVNINVILAVTSNKNLTNVKISG